MKSPTKSERIARLFTTLAAAGFSFEETATLRRIERTLHRWAELECGEGNDYAPSAIERDESTREPYLVTYPHTSERSHRRLIADREGGALKRLETMMAKHNDFLAYHQTDPRGCALYIVRKDDVRPDESVESVYSLGIAICY